MSDKINIPKKFWRDNPLKEMSAAKLTCFKINLVRNQETAGLMDEALNKLLSPIRKEAIKKEIEEIMQIDNAEKLISYMRREHDGMNEQLVRKKAFEMEDAVMPLLLKRYLTSYQDRFIEYAAHIFAECKSENYQKLKDEYQNIRNPYAQSTACLVFGIREDHETIPLLLKEYERMKKLYSGLEGSLEQGPLLALYLLCGPT